MNTRRFPNPFSLPLLTKELIELAARKRTYIMRIVAAILLYLVAGTIIAEEFRQADGNALYMLGSGENMIMAVFACLLGGVYLFLPATMCPAISSERESGTLTLVMLTSLRPWQIILQKLGGRLIPVLSLIFLALPLMAVAYTFGGLESNAVYSGSYVILVAAFQVGAITLMWSAYCRTPGGAFVATYLTLFAMYILWPWFVIGGLGLDDFSNIWIGLMFNPGVLLGMSMQGSMGGGGFWGGPSLYTMSLGVWASTAVALVLARVFLVSRSHVQRRNRLRSFVRAIDSVIAPTQSIASARSRSLPDTKPIAWSELHRRALSKVSYQVIILTCIMVPVLLISALIIADEGGFSGGSSQIEGLSMFLMLLWPLALFAIVITASGLFATERNRQTLDVLLTTPLHTHSIVSEKLAGLVRIRYILAIPLLTVMMFEMMYEWGHNSYSEPSQGPAFILLSIASVVIYLWAVTWVGMWVGMRSKSPRRAVMNAIGAIMLIGIAPLIVGSIFGGLLDAEFLGESVAYVSPIMAFMTLEFGYFGRNELVFIPLVMHLGFWTLVTAGLRALVFNQADKFLGRIAASY